MSGQIARQGILAPQSVFGPQMPVCELLVDYPELAGPLAATTAWRDYQQWDVHSKNFQKMYPSIKFRAPSERNFPM